MQTCIKQNHTASGHIQNHLLPIPVLGLRPVYMHCGNHYCVCSPTALLILRSSPVAMTSISFSGQLSGILDFRPSLEPGLSSVVGPVCSLAQSTTLTLRPSQKEMRALLGGGAAEELPKMEQQPEANPRMVLLHSSQLWSSNSFVVAPENISRTVITTLHCMHCHRRWLHPKVCNVQSCCTAVSTYC